MKTIFLVASALLALGLSGCAYQNPVQQGINLSPAQTAQLKEGMTQSQVSYLLGSPNLVDPYHPNTWYYVYTNQENHQPMTQHQLIVNFDAAGNVTSFQEQ